MKDQPDDGAAADRQDETAAIAIRLDALLSKRQMTLTELSDRVGVTIVNLSVLKNGRARAIRFSTLARPLPRTRLPAGRLAALPDRRSGH